MGSVIAVYVQIERLSNDVKLSTALFSVSYIDVGSADVSVSSHF